MTDQKTLKTMYNMASKALDNAYAVYSQHHVGSVILTKTGNMYVGANSETANYDGLCAEAVAVGTMTTNGDHRNIEAIVVVSPKEHECTPCGRCRQRIFEHAAKDTPIYTYARSGELIGTYTMNDLLPNAFGPDNL